MEKQFEEATVNILRCSGFTPRGKILPTLRCRNGGKRSKAICRWGSKKKKKKKETNRKNLGETKLSKLEDLLDSDALIYSRHRHVVKHARLEHATKVELRAARKDRKIIFGTTGRGGGSEVSLRN